MIIERLNNLDELLDLQHEFEIKNKIQILNVSDWSCSKDFRSALLSSFHIQTNINKVDYKYSYSLSSDTISKIKSNYTFCNEKNDIMITPNNTVSIVYIANLLKQLNTRKICILAPAYFSVYSIFDLLEIPYERISLSRKNGSFTINQEIDFREFDAMWVTSPIFCSGCSYDKDTLKILSAFSQYKIIVTDESFCMLGDELPSKIHLQNHIGIYSPHKAIGFNSFKYSMIVYNIKYCSTLEQWSDVLCGSLNATNVDAINHFLSENYFECQKIYTEYINNAREFVQNELEKYPFLSYDHNSKGNMIMIYLQSQKDYECFDINNLNSLMENTMTTLLPGYLHDYDNKTDCCFRINLSRFDNRFRVLFPNMCLYLKSFTSAQ